MIHCVSALMCVTQAWCTTAGCPSRERRKEGRENASKEDTEAIFSKGTTDGAGHHPARPLSIRRVDADGRALRHAKATTRLGERGAASKGQRSVDCKQHPVSAQRTAQQKMRTYLTLPSPIPLPSSHHSANERNSLHLSMTQLAGRQYVASTRATSRVARAGRWSWPRGDGRWEEVAGMVERSGRGMDDKEGRNGVATTEGSKRGRVDEETSLSTQPS